MKRSISAFLFIALSSAAIVSTHGQTAPSAFKGSFGLQVGGLGSVFQPDYAGNGYAETGPLRLYGAGAYADARFNRWAQIEAEVRFLHFNEFHPPQSQGIYQNTYSIGPRIPIITFHRFTPYGKVLVGWATMADLDGKALAFTYGAGVDYRLSRKFTVRVIDYEYQQWRVVPDDLWPNGGSVGISYRIF
jgi:opacity protein-like surface antigen